MKLTINRRTNGQGFNTFFTHRLRKYYADLRFVPFCGSECMIFKVKRSGEIDWSGVYCKRHIPITEEQLISCIEDFLNE